MEMPPLRLLQKEGESVWTPLPGAPLRQLGHYLADLLFLHQLKLGELPVQARIFGGKDIAIFFGKLWSVLAHVVNQGVAFYLGILPGACISAFEHIPV